MSYYADDTQFFMPLYFSLAVNHNFDDHVKSTDSVKWKGWIAKLKQHIENKSQLDELIHRIDKGELTVILKGGFYPNVQHVVTLIKSIKRLSNLDYNAERQLGHQQLTTDPTVIKKLIEDSKNTPEGVYPEFDPVEFTKRGRIYMDELNDARTGKKRR